MVPRTRRPAAPAARAPRRPRQAIVRASRGAPQLGASTENEGSRTLQGTKRASITMPGMPVITVNTKKSLQPIESASTPATGPASTRGIVNRLERSAYWVAEKRFWVSRSRSTPKAPMPSPLVPSSKACAAYMSGRFTPTWATAA